MIQVRYLRVVNREKFQHYKDRCPPWIKLHRSVITGEDKQFDDFLLLEEWEQWQLVRIWLVASQCAAPHLLAFDELWMRRAIRSTRKVSLEKFIREGYLDVLSADEADALRAASKTPGQTTRPASSVLAEEADVNGASASKTPPFRVSEVTEVSEKIHDYRPVGDSSGEEQTGLAGLAAAAALVEAIRPEHRDDGTRKVVFAAARELPPGDLDQVRHDLEANRDTVRNDGKWVNGALDRIARKRHAGAV